jgi:Skp family chaperone for outer membrane proteins
MTKLLKAALIAAALVTPALASAQTVAVADLDGAVQRTTAYTTAVGQIRTTYATQIAQIDARQKALQAEIQPLVTAFQTAQRAPSPNQAALQTQYTTIQQKQQAAQAELQRLSLPVARAQAYVQEQITGADGAKLNTALKAAMTAKGVQLVLAPQAAISYQPTADLTDAIAAELNKTTATATITPPANWQPGAATAAARPAATPPGR